MVTDESSDVQISALPHDALAGFAEARATLEVAPWGGRPYVRSKPDGALRVLPFGKGGMVVYVIVESQRRVVLLEVLWAG